MEPFGDIIFYTWLCSPKKAGRSPRVLKVREQHASEIREREREAGLEGKGSFSMSLFHCSQACNLW